MHNITATTERRFATRTIPFCSAAALLCAASCWSIACRANDRPDYRTPSSRSNSDPQAAQRSNALGLKCIEKGDYESAEKHFRTALEQDIYYASAHNNLGLVLLHSRRYYDAAWEFDCAAKLAPEAAEPRLNLGLVFEATGRVSKAVDEYETALRIAPDHAVAMRHLARAFVKEGRRDDRLRDLLEKMLGSPGEPQWDVWARGELVRFGREESGQSFPPKAED